MKRIILVLLIIITVSSGLYALELKEGRMRLEMYETSGRISVFCQNELGSSDYTSLLLKQDPRTSGIILIVDNKTQRLGDTFDFEQSINDTRNGAAFNWKSKTLDVTQSFSFVTSPGNSIADGVKMEIEIKNISEQTLSIGLKYLFDTWLGETGRGRPHFYTSDAAEIADETVLKGIMPSYWISSEKYDSDIGLLMMLDNSVVTQPDKVIFANWKRLDESGWTLNTKDGRNFNLLPYSINDSAAAHYYDPVRVPSGGTRKITIVLGNVSREGFTETVKAEEESSLEDLYNRVSTENTGNIETVESSIKNELILTEDLITHIDRLLESNEPLTDDELETLNVMIEKIETNRNKFKE